MSSYKSVFNALQNQFEQFARDGEPGTETAICQRIDTREQSGRALLQALNDGPLNGIADIDGLIQWVAETAPKLATDDITLALLAWHKFCGVDLFGLPNEAGQCKMILFSRDGSIPLVRLVPGGILDPLIVRRYRGAAPGDRDVTRLVRAFDGVDRAMNQRFALACVMLADVPAQPEKTEKGNATGRKRRRAKGEWLTNALLTLKRHPDWSDMKIAAEIGVNRSTLNRCRIYRAAKSIKIISPPPNGYPIRDDDGFYGVEATDAD